MTDGAATRPAFVERLPFPLDPFQLRALDSLDAGHSVLVAAPTGSGKTVVADYAIDIALAGGGKAFYTTPIKALSNQKHGDLVRRLGPERVGLLTGDNSINGDAPVVVMTTEVLRNMIYAGSPALHGLRWVILDEVHYLQDHYRGPVWEEVIIHLPPRVGLVCLSATVSNAEELSDWITTVRGACDAVIEERRPVELVNLYLVGDKGSPDLHLLPTLVDGRANPEASRLDAESLRSRPGRPDRGRPRRRFYTPNRLDVVDLLAEENLLPAIYFIFSRAACDDAVKTCLDAGVRLTTADERERIREIVDSHVAGLSDADLRVLGYGRWSAAVEAGIAAHHAGMVPPFKEAVEACFAAGLVKVVFATETLALGINMPARTVVIEKLTKFTGERHELLTPGDYTQLTGRAGRRGIDPVGHAVVLWSPFVPFEQVASLAASRSFRLTSAFRPTYNMAANLVQRYEPAEAHHLLNLSFAQYQADASVVAMETRLEKRAGALAEAEAMARCERGGVEEYGELLRAEDDERRRLRPGREEIAAAVARLKPGDIIHVDGAVGRAGVISAAHRKGESTAGVRVRVVTARRKLVTLGVDDFDEPPEALTSVPLPSPYLPNSTRFRLAMAERVAAVRVPRRHADAEPDTRALDAAHDAVVSHPVHACSDRDDHLAALERVQRLRREVEDLTRSVKGRTESLARRFDRVLRLLEAWDYLDGWVLTDRGATLARLYHECDLLVAEALHEGLFDDLDPAALAGLASVFGYEHRSPSPPPAPWYPTPGVKKRYHRIESLSRELLADEDTAGLPMTREPDPTFLAIAHAWAAGEGLEEVLEDEDVTPGDFVRVVKQVIDLLRQVGDVAPTPDTTIRAREAADALHRGVVAISSAVVTDEAPAVSEAAG
jgi:ATP-dependent RNA helicase HelY